MSKRYRVLFLIWLLQFVNYLDRVNISVAAPSMMKSLSIDTASFGWVLAAFTVGYAIMQLPGGLLADKFGAKIMLVCAPLLWSVFTGLTGVVETTAALIVVRLCFGLAEGSSNAACYKLVGDYFTPRERATANSVWITALALGPALVAPLASWALRSVGWERMFLLFSLPGILLAAVLWFAMPSAPPKTPDHIDESHAAGWLWLLKRPGSWLLFFGYLTFNICFWGFLGWMPGYLAIQRHLDLKALGYAASIPYICGFAGILTMGWLGSHALYRFRGQMVAMAYLCAAGTLYMAYTSTDILTCLIGLCCSAFFMYGGFGPYASLALDLAPVRERAAFVGFVNTGGQIGGITAPVIVGYVVRTTGSFNGGFDLMVCALMASAACYLALSYCMQPSTKIAVPV
nr:MFS transporter [Paraburkholderia caledonica]